MIMIDSWGTVHFNKKPRVKRKRETFPNRAYYSLCFRMTNKLSEFRSRIPNIPMTDIVLSDVAGNSLQVQSGSVDRVHPLAQSAGDSRPGAYPWCL